MAVGVSGANAVAAAAPGRRITGAKAPVKERKRARRRMEPMRVVGGGVPGAASRGRQTRRDAGGGGRGGGDCVISITHMAVKDCLCLPFLYAFAYKNFALSLPACSPKSSLPLQTQPDSRLLCLF